MPNVGQEERPATMPPVRALWEQWRQQQCPDFEDFVAAGGRLTPDQALAVLRYDQHQRWHAGERMSAESYLQRYRLLREDADAGLLLAYSEFALRQELGEAPALAEYLGRFPHYADGLRQHHAFRGALAAAATPTVLAAQTRTAATTRGAAGPAPAGPGWPAIPGYEVLGELGRGGMGVVYKARQVALNRLVALKMILAGAHASAAELARFRAEAEAVARLQHPNVVQIHEVGEQDGLPYFSLEFCAEGSLAAKLDGTPWPAHRAAGLIQTLARAVQAAHQCGIVHRDLKPANVLLAAGGFAEGAKPQAAEPIPKLTDFGLSKRIDGEKGQTRSGAIMGTPSYMAPEQAGGRNQEVGPATDVYALGAILYELLTGRPPFNAATPLDTVLQVLSEESVSPRRLQPAVPRDLETICQKCLHKEPGGRYASADALAEDLRRFLAGEPIRARPVSPAARLYRWCRRKPVVAGLLALVFVLAAGAFTAVTALWLRADRLRVQAENDRAQAENDRADAAADYGLARDSVDGYAVRVSEDLRLREEDLRPLRKKLLETAVPFYERLVKRHADNPEVQAERGKAYKRLALITEEIDDQAKAVPLYQKALPLLEEQLRAHPGDRNCIRDVTECRVNLAALYHLTGRAGDAEAEYRRLLVWQGQLARDHPDEVQYQDDLARNHNNLAGLYSDTGRHAEAVAEQEEAVKVQHALAEAHPTVADYTQHLATGRGTLALFCRFVGQDRRAEDEYGKAVAALEALAQADPNNTGHQQELAVVLSQLGGLYADTGRAAQAIPRCERAVRLLEAVVRQSPSVTKGHQDLSQCQSRLADIYQETGRQADAERLYGRAIELYEQLRGQNPKVHSYQHYLAAAHKALGFLHFNARRLARAEEEFQKALKIGAGLVEQHPGFPAYVRDLAIDRTNLAAVYQQTGRAALAEPEYERALALLEALAASGQAGNTYEATLAECRLSLATLYYRTGRLAQAEELYGKGLRTAEAIVHEKPDAAKDALTLAMIYSSLGKVTHARAETAAAVGWFDKAIGLLNGWVEKAPENVAFRSQLRDARAGRVRALSRLGRHADALTECEQALTIDTPQTRDALRALRALTLGRQGAWARAQAEAEELVQAKDLSGGTLYELAGAYSLAAAAVTQDKDLLPADRTERAGRYATRAVELLVRAREAGYFNSAANVEGMRKDSDLGVLRPRADYQQLLNELMKKPQPGAK